MDVYRLILEKLRLGLSDYFKSECPERRCGILDLGSECTCGARDLGTKFSELRGLGVVICSGRSVSILE